MRRDLLIKQINRTVDQMQSLSAEIIADDIINNEALHDDFYQGVALAIAYLIKAHDQPTMAMDILKANGISVNKLLSHGLDEYDAKEIRKLKQSPPAEGKEEYHES